jgi:3-deoxy-D-manno-octulosonic acid kinase
MTNGRRIATATGAMLADPASLGNPPLSDIESLFDPEFWRARGELRAVSGGRGSAWFVESGARRWVLRHCRRGGFIARWSRDRYVWTGEERVRAFAEWRLLDVLARHGLPVPKPVAARYQRSGLSYRCDLITQRIAYAQPLSAVLAKHALPEASWRAVGSCIARLHAVGVDHADLNAHNILIGGCEEIVRTGAFEDEDEDGDGGGSEMGGGREFGGGESDAIERSDAIGRGEISVIDFDRGRLRAPGRWRLRNLKRLQRSLIKISQALPDGRYSAPCWEWFMAGYQAAASRRETA